MDTPFMGPKHQLKTAFAMAAICGCVIWQALLSPVFAQEALKKAKVRAAAVAKVAEVAEVVVREAVAKEGEAKDKPKPDEAEEKARAAQIDAAYKGFNPLQTKGPMEKIAEPLSKVAGLKWDGSQLVADIPKTHQDVNEAMTEIRSAASGGGSGHGSTNYWVQSFYGQELSGMLRRGDQSSRGRGDDGKGPDPFQIRALEMIKQGREMIFSGESMDEFNILISGGNDPWLFHFQQQEDGHISVHEIADKEVFSGSSNDFESFCREYSDYVQSRLIPILKQHGVRPPVTRFNPVARDQVLASISDIDPKREAEFKEAFAGLDSSEYDEREATSKVLEEKYDQWKDIIRRVMNDPNYSFETRARLSKLVKARSTKEDRELLDMVTSNKLAEDADYLIWLLEQAEPKFVEAIATQLARVTGEDLGNDLAKWREWNGDQRPAESRKTPSEFVSLAETKGFIQQMAEPISNLIRLDIVDDRLVLNRKEWAAQFKGKTIKELVTATRDEVKTRNLPSTWFNPQVSHQDDEADYAQVLFQNVQTSVPTGSNRNHYGYNNMYAYHNSQMNKHFEQPHLDGVLKLQPNRDQNIRGQNFGNKPTQFKFIIREHEASEQLLQVFEAKDKSLTLQIAAREANSMLQIHQPAKGGCSLRLLQGDKTIVLDAKNFAELYKENEKQITQEVLPIFQRYGLQVSKNLGGPLEIKNQAKKK